METLKVRELNKTYNGKVSYEALTNINLTINKGEFVGIMGPSGSGKTTLLNMISTIDTPTSGEVLINEKNPDRLPVDELALFRRRELGFIFQSFNLLNTLTVKENIVLPLTLENVNLSDMNKRVESISIQLGIEKILHKRLYEISGGQAQRTAIARALIHSPQLVLADEPTGNLDSKAANDVMQLLVKLNKEYQTTMVLVTHDPLVSSYCDRVVFIKDGMLYNEIKCEDNRLIFYKKIMDELSLSGGTENEFSSIGLE
ncbi:bacitracin ABC transporter ATP-binding protein [Bacillus toyonensis]|uniref:ABC transporter ATP-binding protein n=1 Tax=Bacillus toyonensis TaxID=155322 RepID=UPI000BF160CD|nr:ABC transporter ATP-binding protein [Bacillus toyonensis]PEN40609.1 bacitracin ABC transporter ATP-binding protein [Bacillus toyonensis]PEO07916.1 bacitracin ABC transporter ATP-binding protein [Bacillus toyonensis]